MGIRGVIQAVRRRGGRATLTAAAISLLVAQLGVQPAYALPGDPSSVQVTLSPDYVPANGAATSNLTATVRDSAGAPVVGATVVLSTSGDVRFGTVTDNTDGTYTAVVTASTTPGPETITATATGGPSNASKAGGATLNEYGPAATIQLVLNPNPIVANGTATSAATATVRDAGGNKVPGQSVTITTNGDSSISSVTGVGDGTYKATITASRTADTEVITATNTTPAAPQSTTQELTEVPGPTDHITLDLNPPAIVADGAAKSTATVTVFDVNNNRVATETVTVTTNGDATISPVSNKGDGTYTATITASKSADSETITAKTSNNKQATKTLTENAGPAASIAVSVSPSSIPANGSSTATAVGVVKDANNNPVQSETVTFTTSGDVAVGPTINQGNGTYSAGITASNTPGIETITGTTSNGKSGTAQLSEFGAVGSVTLTLNPGKIRADGSATSTGTATLKDSGGNPVTNAAPVFSTNGDVTFSTVTNHFDGTYTVTIKASTTADTEVITVSSSGKSAQADLVEFGPADKVSVAVTPAAITADGSSTSTGTATVTDVNGVRVSDETVTFSTSGDVTFGPVTNNGDGTYKVTITASTTSGTETITARTSNAKTGTATLTENAGPAAGVTVALTPSAVTADGASTSSAKATVTDVNNNPVKSETVTFSTSGDVEFSPVTNNGDGTYSSTITSSKTAGTETITARTSNNKTGTATLTENPGPAAGVQVTLTPSTIVADGASTSSAKATVVDANNNRVPGPTVTFKTDGDVTFGPVTNNGDGTHTSTITSSKTADVETITATTSNNKSGSAPLTETAGPASAVTLQLTPSSVVADGSSVSSAKATVTDVNNNPVKSETVTFSTSGDVTFGPVTNNGDGTYSSTITSSKTADAETITVTTSNAKMATATLTETPGPTDHVEVTLTPSSVTADGASTSTGKAAVLDANNNRVSGPTVSFGTSGDVTFGPVTNNGDGTHTVQITSSKTAGAETITATTSDGKTGTATLTENAGPVDTVTVTLSPSSVPADGAATSTASGVLKDVNGNLVGAKTVTFLSSGDVTFPSGNTCTTSGSGSCSVTVKASKTAGAETITATSGGKSGTATLTETSLPVSLPAIHRGNVIFPKTSSSTGSADGFIYGNPGDQLVFGDWDGNGSKTPAVVRNGTWFVRNSNSGGSADFAFSFGIPGDIAVAGDWNGDGFDTIGVVRGNTWYLTNLKVGSTNGAAEIVFSVGNPGDVPIVCDWGGSGFDSWGVVRGTQWFLSTRKYNDGAGIADRSFTFGNPGDIAVAGDWNGDRRCSPGVFRAGQWFLNDNQSGDGARTPFFFGSADDRGIHSWRP